MTENKLSFPELRKQVEKVASDLVTVADQLRHAHDVLFAEADRMLAAEQRFAKRDAAPQRKEPRG